MKTTTALSSSAIALCAACALTLSVGAPSLARADVTDELLEIMRAKGDLTPEQYKSLKARHQQEKAAYGKTAPAKASGGGVQAVAIKKGGAEYVDAPPPPPSVKDGGGAEIGAVYVTALPKGVGVRIGNVEFQTSGDISFFAAEEFPQSRKVFIDGGLLPSGFENDAFAIRAGLLPSSLQFEVRTNQMGYDLAAHFSMYIGGNNIDVGATPLNANSIGAPFGLGTPGIDFRQVYGTIGTPYAGTVKFGRDIGLFAADAILNDATIFGSGTPNNNAIPGNTALGRIGFGYVYADWLPQITYTTPDYNGFTASFGVMTPLKTIDVLDSGFDLTPASATLNGQASPMVQGRLRYKGTPFGSGPCGMKDASCDAGPTITAWTSGLWQDHQFENGDFITDPSNPAYAAGAYAYGRRAGDSVTSWAVDGGVKVDWAGFSILGYAYTGEGLGTTALFWNAFSLNGEARTSDGGYVQGYYTFFDRFTLGASWGISHLGRNAGDPPTLVKDAESTIGFAKYKLTDWVQFQAEYIYSEQTNYAPCTNAEPGCKITNDAFVIGTTFFW